MKPRLTWRRRKVLVSAMTGELFSVSRGASASCRSFYDGPYGPAVTDQAKWLAAHGHIEPTDAQYGDHAGSVLWDITDAGRGFLESGRA